MRTGTEEAEVLRAEVNLLTPTKSPPKKKAIHKALKRIFGQSEKLPEDDSMMQRATMKTHRIARLVPTN